MARAGSNLPKGVTLGRLTTGGERKYEYQGREVSRREVNRLRAETLGLKGGEKGYLSFVNRLKNDRQFQRELAWQAEKTGKSKKELMSVNSQVLKDYRKTFFRPDGKPKNLKGVTSKLPNSPLAKWLEKTGRRQKGAPYNVGETP